VVRDIVLIKERRILSKKQANDSATPPDSLLRTKLAPNRFTITDEETLKRLTGLQD